MRRLLIAIALVMLLGLGFALLSRSERAERSEKMSPPVAPRAAPAQGTGARVSDAPARAVPQDELRHFDEIRRAVRENRLGDARAMARAYLQAYPHGVLRADVETYTGVRLRPSGPDAQ